MRVFPGRQTMLAWSFALGAAAVMTAIGAVQPAHAQWTSPFPWCAQRGATLTQFNDCSFYTFQQCLATVTGEGGHCYPNPTYVGPPEEPRRNRKARHPKPS